MAFLVATTSLPAVYHPNGYALTTTAGTPHARANTLLIVKYKFELSSTKLRKFLRCYQSEHQPICPFICSIWLNTLHLTLKISSSLITASSYAVLNNHEVFLKLLKSCLEGCQQKYLYAPYRLNFFKNTSMSDLQMVCKFKLVCYIHIIKKLTLQGPRFIFDGLSKSKGCDF